MALTPLVDGGMAEAVNTAAGLLLAYSDDSSASLNSEIGVISFAGAAAGLTALFFLLTKNLQTKSFSFVLDEAEQAAVDAVTAIFDPTARFWMDGGLLKHVLLCSLMMDCLNCAPL